MRRRVGLATVLVIALVAGLLPVGVVAALADAHLVLIHEIQGSGAESPRVGDEVIIRGIVVGDFQGDEHGDRQLRGFYVQEEDLQHDDDPATSEGIFVFHDSTDVAPGDDVEVRGTVGEFGNQTQLSSATVVVHSQGNSVTETVASLPVGAISDLERYEGMLITFDQDLYISEFFNFDRFGEIVLTTERQYQPTQVAEPGSSEAEAVKSANALSRITLDDGRTSQNPDPALHPDGAEFTLDNSFRGGDILREVTGVLGQSRFGYRIQPTEGATHINANPRPSAPEPVGGDIKVASFNVLNFFTHLDDRTTTDDDICGPTGNLECRGANTEEELRRQLDKLVAGIIALDADIVGIQEIENDIYDDDGNRAHDAVLTLAEALNDAEGAETWAWAGETNHYNDYPVRNEIIFRASAVEPVGDPIALEHEAFDQKRPGDIEPVGRPPLAQTFRQTAVTESGQPFTVVNNHFKSKGSSCASLDDPFDPWQANCNLTRVAQAEALLDFIEELEEDSSGVLVIGDLNSYAMEDPIDTLEAGGLVNLVDRYIGSQAYSFVFDGQLGNLDTALATRSMSNWVTGLTIFHINADEQDILDYDMTFKQDAQDALYEPNAYRSSDHDPVIVGVESPGDG